MARVNQNQFFSGETTKFWPSRGLPLEVIHMTNEQKVMIDNLRSQGLGYKRVAAKVGLSENTVKSYFRRNTPMSETPAVELRDSIAETHNCLRCGAPVAQNLGRKEKKFCSSACRNAWWNSHLDQVNRKAIYKFICPVCGKGFSVYGKKNRKYCSHACYIPGRFGGVECV